MNQPPNSSLPEATFPDVASLGAPPDVCSSRTVVMKFGGTSVTGRDNWQTITTLIKNRMSEGLKPFIVHSAFAGVSDLLDKICRNTDLDKNIEQIIDLHRSHASELGLDGDSILSLEFATLQDLSQKINSHQNTSALVTAQLMGLGEFMSTRLSSAFLRNNNIDATWINACKHLKSIEQPHRSTRQQQLSAVCDFAVDSQLQQQIADQTCVLTQGFVAANDRGETTILGRGGSDSSAAYFAAKLQARRLEIWTDVPGMFSADPRQVPSARLLKAIHFNEAQEIAAMGSTVLHPHSLVPTSQCQIPVFVRCTAQPWRAGTTIARITPDSEAQVKAISCRNGLKLVSMESVTMWQQAGFLADAFAIFGRHGISVDLVSTSESNVTVSIDANDAAVATTDLSSMLDELSTICSVSVIENCASVSLVGQNIRTMLHKLGPAMEVFEEHKIHLVSQAANDLNLTFVVDQDQGERLVHKLHSALIKEDTTHSTFGPSWTAMHDRRSTAPIMRRWWEERSEALLDLMANRDCAYVYDRATINKRARDLQSLSAVSEILYAIKANSNRDLLKAVHATGLSFECVSPGELTRLFDLFPEIDRNRILYTPNFATRADYRCGFEAGVIVNVDNLYPLRHWGEDFSGRDIFVRLDPGQGRGHHELVRTAGSHSKFGIPVFELDELADLTRKHNIKVRGIHAHSGSGIMDPENWNEVGHILSEAANLFDTVKVIDLGGGLGVPEKPGDAPLDFARFNDSLNELKNAHPKYDLWLEPGRFVVAECGVLLARVTQTKGKGDVQYVGVATGMNSLIRPALYGAWHEIVNLSRLDETATERYTVVGPNCETGDRLGLDRLLPPCQEGDVLLIANTGAYGYAMSSHYNLREPAEEIVI